MLSASVGQTAVLFNYERNAAYALLRAIEVAMPVLRCSLRHYFCYPRCCIHKEFIEGIE
jgi:hypothetical protein